jgi:uncharacterized protein YbaP (TraB family)
MKRSKFYIQISLISAILAITGFENVYAQKKNIENSLFWEISGNGLKKSSYLFGTYHLLNSGFLDEIPKVKEAFKKADGVVVETELDSSIMVKMMFMMVMKDKKISDLINADDYAIVSKEVLEVTGAPMDMMGQFKPSFIMVMLSLSYSQKENGEVLKKYGGHPLDSYFAAEAKKLKKPLGTFETMEEQIAMVFDHDPVEKQAEQLVDFVKMKKELAGVQTELLNAYIREDLAGLFKLYKKYEEQFGDTSYLLDDRNVKWMDKLPEYLSKGNQFIAVGALHFTGEKGLIKLLRGKGYRVEQLISR